MENLLDKTFLEKEITNKNFKFVRFLRTTLF